MLPTIVLCITLIGAEEPTAKDVTDQPRWYHKARIEQWQAMMDEKSKVLASMIPGVRRQAEALALEQELVTFRQNKSNLVPKIDPANLHPGDIGVFSKAIEVVKVLGEHNMLVGAAGQWKMPNKPHRREGGSDFAQTGLWGSAAASDALMHARYGRNPEPKPPPPEPFFLFGYPTKGLIKGTLITPREVYFFRGSREYEVASDYKTNLGCAERAVDAVQKLLPKPDLQIEGKPINAAVEKTSATNQKAMPRSKSRGRSRAADSDEP